jgi:hypothetical protein
MAEVKKGKPVRARRTHCLHLAMTDALAKALLRRTSSLTRVQAEALDEREVYQRIRISRGNELASLVSFTAYMLIHCPIPSGAGLIDDYENLLPFLPHHQVAHLAHSDTSYAWPFPPVKMSPQLYRSIRNSWLLQRGCS